MEQPLVAKAAKVHAGVRHQNLLRFFFFFPPCGTMYVIMDSKNMSCLNHQYRPGVKITEKHCRTLLRQNKIKTILY